MLMIRWAVLALCGVVLVGCAENPSLSYANAGTEQECQQEYEAELRAWQIEQAAQKTADQQVEAFFRAFTNGIGLYQGEELFKRRRAVCLHRVQNQASTLVYQPGSGGNARPYACRGGGGVLQGGAAICPGH